MTRKRRSRKDAELVKMQLADIIQDVFDKNGQIVTHEVLAKRHVLRNGSTTAAEDVQVYGGMAVAHLRQHDPFYAIVPITKAIEDYNGDPDNEPAIVNAVAGLGAGGSRIGWYQPVDKDDWLWVYYIGHLARSGLGGVFHATDQVDKNRQLNSGTTRKEIAKRAIDGMEKPPSLTETKVLTARIEDQP